MQNKFNKREIFMMISNIFLVLPVIFAAIYQEWLYCFFASGLFIFSPLYHWTKITAIKSGYFVLFKTSDWLFAFGAFFYMYFYVNQNISSWWEITLYLLLSFVILFFLYGWRKADYEKWHPWFHIVAPVVSSIILIVAH